MRKASLDEVLNFIENMDGIELQKVTNTILKNYNVCILLDEPSFGGSAVSQIISGYNGFDWDSGKFLLQAGNKLIKGGD